MGFEPMNTDFKTALKDLANLRYKPLSHFSLKISFKTKNLLKFFINNNRKLILYINKKILIKSAFYFKNFAIVLIKIIFNIIL